MPWNASMSRPISVVQPIRPAANADATSTIVASRAGRVALQQPARGHDERRERHRAIRERGGHDGEVCAPCVASVMPGRT
jgi:hypothetical protein